MRVARFFPALSVAPFVLGCGLLASAGCENKEKIIDVETPGGQVEVERNRDTGEVDVEATDNN